MSKTVSSLIVDAKVFIFMLEVDFGEVKIEVLTTKIKNEHN